MGSVHKIKSLNYYGFCNMMLMKYREYNKHYKRRKE